jgi:predicted polyphosphate/ATP-dependent NAD kinase
MTTVGIIANPASGKDIRRLVAHGSVFNNLEKVSIVRRALLGLQATGVEEIIFMPDYFGIGARAIDGLKLALKTSTLKMPLRGTQDDSTEAADRFRDMQVGCIITRGGDGTNRAVAKGCGKIPLLPISTGTNNVFPYMIEGSIAGLAAGVVTLQMVQLDRVIQQTKRLEIEIDKKDRISIRLTNNGPYVIDIKGALKEAAQNGFFMNSVRNFSGALNSNGII